MPKETKEAVEWAIKNIENKENYFDIVEKVCEYFEINNIEYGTFSILDLKPFLPK